MELSPGTVSTTWASAARRRRPGVGRRAAVSRRDRRTDRFHAADRSQSSVDYADMLAALQRGWGTVVASLAAGRLQLSKTAEPVLSGLYHGNAMKMFDVVASLQDLPQQQVVKGQVGTVLEELDNDHVLVEFADVNGVAYAIATIPMGQLMKLKHAPA